MSRIKVEKNIAFDEERKLFYVTMDYGTDETTGKRNRKTETFATKREAQNSLHIFQASKVNGTALIPSYDTVEQWLRYWLQSKKINCQVSTLYGYTNIIENHLIPQLGKLSIQKVGVANIIAYIAQKDKDGLAKNTIRKHFDLLKEVFGQAVKEGKINKNPLDIVPVVKKVKKEQACYNPEQVVALFQVIKGHRIEVPILLGCLLGLRREEIAGLKWEQIDFENEIITINNARLTVGDTMVVKETKTSSSNRKLRMPKEISEKLLALKEEQDKQRTLLGTAYKDNGYVVVWEDGELIRPNYITEKFKEILQTNKFPLITFHDLRHTFASLANASGATMYDISKALGHASLGVTSGIYTHMFDDTHKKAIDNVSGIINSQISSK